MFHKSAAAALLAAALLFGKGPFPASVGRDEVVRPERPEGERGQGGLPPQSSVSRMEGGVIEAVRLA